MTHFRTSVGRRPSVDLGKQCGIGKHAQQRWYTPPTAKREECVGIARAFAETGLIDKQSVLEHLFKWVIGVSSGVDSLSEKSLQNILCIHIGDWV
ncbi:hypothetical protein NPIL_334221 [Nephila pilipes]|uniref:Uncharacterized protein n=1 Tax=Nephila pilipes TaxID=299642 RepID=A0A8X6T5J6_NEPPI|nr:hypothetical protein NPIL_334221 [Nephila pilipes]